MIVELRGINAENKGAELMLHAALQQLQGWSPAPRTVLGVGPGNYRGAWRLGLDRVATLRKRWIDLRLPTALATPPLDRLHRLVPEQRIEVVLDASGFAYGDPWGPAAIRSLARFLRRWKTPQRRFVMLPQALGPFRTAASRRWMGEVLEQVDLVFAREPRSFAHIEELDPPEAVLAQAPDFTNLTRGALPASLTELAGQVAVVPNARMIEKTGSDAAQAYPQLLRALVAQLHAADQPAFFLIHDTGDDLKLARELNRGLERPLRIVQLDDPLAIKGLLGASRLAISSRFHGLVSALSQGVPVLAMGWSYKYRELLQDYRCPEQLLEDLADLDGARARLATLLDATQRQAQVEVLRAAAVEQTELSLAMWSRVRQLLGR